MDYSSFILFSRYVLELLQLRLLNFSALYLSISKYSTKHNKVDNIDIELVASELISLHFFLVGYSTERNNRQGYCCCTL